MKFTKKQKLKANRKALREIDLEFGLPSGLLHKVHKSEKDYNRKLKHKKHKFEEE
jgi:hypothetical protein